MTQDNNIQQDTPQPSANEEFTSLEEAVFGGEGSDSNVSGAFTSGEEGNANPAPQGQPGQEYQNIPPQPNNDETRYQYWQSQSDKYKNELESLKQQVQQTQVQPQQAQPQEQVPADTGGYDEFPPAPDKPQRPRTYSREEAYSDPSSESARYLDELEGWRDDMNEYNSLKSQYQTAVIEDKFNAMEQERINNIKRAEAQQKTAAQISEVKNHVMGHYGMNDNEANDFMQKMSNPNSITVDNLVQLYRMQNGGAAPQQNPAPAQPSEAFTQTKNAQQIPSPMGVMPSGNSNVDGRTMEDKIMDTMIGNFNSKNPWK